MEEGWIDFEPAWCGVTLKRKPWYYWLWVRVKGWFGIKTKLEFEKIDRPKAQYKIDGKTCHVRIKVEPIESKMTITLPFIKE